MKFWCLLVISDAVVLVSSELYRSDNNNRHTAHSVHYGDDGDGDEPVAVMFATSARCCCADWPKSRVSSQLLLSARVQQRLSQTGISYWSDQSICELKRYQSVIEKQSSFQAQSLLTCFCPYNNHLLLLIIKMRKWWVCRKHPYIALQFYNPVLK